jgi:hypothetical protein
MAGFIDKIACGVSYDPAQVVGYSEGELSKIERLYDIKLRGHFREFMLDMGRSDGGLIGDDPIVLYREGMSIRRHILYQLRLEFDFKEFRIGEGLSLLRHRPFVFSCESETQYHFVTTESDDPERVYRYDENEETVTDTEESFIEYMKRIVAHYNQPNWEVEYMGKTTIIPNNRANVICRGELLIV